MNDEKHAEFFKLYFRKYIFLNVQIVLGYLSINNGIKMLSNNRVRLSHYNE